MANMTFKASLLPSTDLGYSLGSNETDNIKRWKFYGTLYGNADSATGANITTTANSVAYYSDTTGTFASDADFLWDAENNKLTAAKLNGYVMAGQKSGTTLGTKATAEGYDTTASGYYSHAEGNNTTASQNNSHAEGILTIASGSASHAEGNGATASGNHSHAEGQNTKATGDNSHTEGYITTASGTCSHAEGNNTTASGNNSHAEGYYTTASGNYSHAEGYYTTAQPRSQHVFGEYNILDTTGSKSTRGTYIEIVGNGANYTSRSNARTLDWEGNESLAGNLLPMITNSKTLGSSSLKWNNVYATTFTGNLTGNASTATKLATARNLTTKLDSTTAVTFDGSADQNAIPVTGTLPIAHGGTGATTAADARTNLGISYPVTSVATKTGDVTLGTLTIGNKTYNGSANTTIEIADLGLASTTTFLGITSTDLSNGSTTSPVNIVIGPTTGNVTPTNGSVVMEQDTGEEYIWTGGKWNLMGLASSWALANHIHGNILSNGTITSDTTIGNGQHLVITDSNNKVSRSSLSFDTTKTTEYLTHAGTWATPTDDHKVKQNAAISTAGAYPIILATSTATTEQIESVNKTSTLTYNPSTQRLHVPILEVTSSSYGDILPESAVNGQLFFQISDGYTYELPNGGTAGQALIKNSNNDRDVTWSDTVPNATKATQDGLGNVITSTYVKKAGDTMTGTLKIGHSTYGQCLELWSDLEGGNIFFRCAGTDGVASDIGYEFDTYNNNLRLYRTDNGGNGATAQLTLMDSNGYSTFIRGYGAVWNDYAECRETKEYIEPGRCIRELGDDSLELTTERLQRGCEIVSDTFGFAIGKTEKAQTPTAASGRVLAYLYEDRKLAKEKIGWPVCSGPNGTVSIMTEEEEQKYPSRIIGTISAVPDYEIWHGGNEGTEEIHVNGRIWIRVR